MINLLYEGDIGPDPCDFSTISVLHEYHRRGMINLVGVARRMPYVDLQYLQPTVWSRRANRRVP